VLGCCIHCNRTSRVRRKSSGRSHQRLSSSGSIWRTKQDFPVRALICHRSCCYGSTLRPFVAVSLAKPFHLTLPRTCFGAVLMSVAGLPRTIPSESRVGLLQLLLKSGAEAPKADDDGYTALHWAAAIGA
jgi:hypothetical protein